MKYCHQTSAVDEGKKPSQEAYKENIVYQGLVCHFSHVSSTAEEQDAQIA